MTHYISQHLAHIASPQNILELVQADVVFEGFK